ncbi:hypothetical protein ACFFUB_09315 [Algimonas porphyrae]|uniref:Uncharacterized protein n=1 Tax=Algimonas porphyrae TaxID=1128113 RepID=A0ABQ5V3R3_9PROT|nr:hypothetical protein [Algimonas porphyrae]GLQ21687.1 hypothetical protein GCM10007854_26420 [Algimonas porphyrae]
MILRRIKAHVEKENWFAVGIDFCIVVVGVFIGLQVANWNDARADVSRGQDYRQRLAEDMVINRQNLQGRRSTYLEQSEYGTFAIETNGTPVTDANAWEIVRAYFQASHAFTLTLQRGTYDEIISSGHLALLDDQALVNDLAALYTFAGLSTISTIPDYRERVRRIIPLTLQAYFQSACYNVTDQDIHLLIACPPPPNAEIDLIALASILQSDSELERDLRYMMSLSQVSAGMAANQTKRVDAIFARLPPPKTGGRQP